MRCAIVFGFDLRRWELQLALDVHYCALCPGFFERCDCLRVLTLSGELIHLSAGLIFEHDIVLFSLRRLRTR